MAKPIDVISPDLKLNSKQASMYCTPEPYRLSVGGIRSGKTWSAMLYGIIEVLLRYNRSDILLIRRTFRQLEMGLVADFKSLVNPKAYEWNESKHIATFRNGSRAVFGSCPHDLESEIMQYLGQGYPFILADEVAQFSPDIWEMMVSRNTLNAGCQPDKDGNFPKPVIWGCTNPIGPWWHYYKAIFIDGKPFPVPEGAVKQDDGRYTVVDAGVERTVYDPAKYAWMHSTVLDNPALLERDPEILNRLNALPGPKRAKMLLGVLDSVEGQYFECWEPEHHTVNVQLHPEAVQWLTYEKVWGGWDWGVGHANMFYWFTRAMVKRPNLDADYKLRVVCFKEYKAPERSDYEDDVEEIVERSILPNGNRVAPSAIFFSHEKFAQGIERNTPADKISRALRKHHFPAVSPATRDRIARATFTRHELQARDLIILTACPVIIEALPQLQTDPNRLDDVKKVDNAFDDAYDAFSYGLFGQLGPSTKPALQEKAESIRKIQNPFQRKLAAFKLGMEQISGGRPKARWEHRMRMPH